ncbi:MAG: periplasmic heavy metal sensor [Cytophagales bacterium]|nr:periplasmic heavy metal sensor [Cytophagales bacterium]
MKKTFLILLIGVCTLGAIAQSDEGESRSGYEREHNRERSERQRNRDRGERTERQRNRARGERSGHLRERGIAMLNLTDAQKDQMKMMRIAHEKAIKSDQQTLKLKMVELSNLVANDDPSEQEVSKLTDEIGGLQTALLKAQIAHRIEVRTILDEEQKLKFDKMKLRRGPAGKRGM